MNRIKAKQYILIWSLSFIVLFINDFFHFREHNKFRGKILRNSATANAEITGVSNSIKIQRARFPGAEYYKFFINGNMYNGVTFYRHLDKIGDSICIRYNLSDPQLSIYCKEQQHEVIEFKHYFGYGFASSLFVALIFIIEFIKQEVKKRFPKKETST